MREGGVLEGGSEREGINDWDSLEIFLADHC